MSFLNHGGRGGLEQMYWEERLILVGQSASAILMGITAKKAQCETLFALMHYWRQEFICCLMILVMDLRGVSVMLFGK